MDHKSQGLVIGLISSNWLYLIYYRCISIDYHPSRGRISALYPLTQIKDWLSETLKKNVSFLSGSGHEMKVMLKCTIMNGCFCRAAVKFDFMLWAGTFQSAAETRRCLWCYSHRWWIPTPCWRPSPARRAVSLHYCYIDPRYYNRARKKHLIFFIPYFSDVVALIHSQDGNPECVKYTNESGVWWWAGPSDGPPVRSKELFRVSFIRFRTC